MKLSIELTEAEFDALREVARVERRRPRDQAAEIVAEYLATVATRAAWDAEVSERRALAEATQETDPTEKGESYG